MIVYNMKCAGGHAYEGWFASSAEYEAKAAAHELSCPECGDTHVEKGLSAPRVNGSAAAEPAIGPCGMPCGSTGPGMCGMGG